MSKSFLTKLSLMRELLDAGGYLTYSEEKPTAISGAEIAIRGGSPDLDDMSRTSYGLDLTIRQHYGTDAVFYAVQLTAMEQDTLTAVFNHYQDDLQEPRTMARRRRIDSFRRAEPPYYSPENYSSREAALRLIYQAGAKEEQAITLLGSDPIALRLAWAQQCLYTQAEHLEDERYERAAAKHDADQDQEDNKAKKSRSPSTTKESGRGA